MNEAHTQPLPQVQGVTLQYKTREHLVTATYRVSFDVHPADRFVLLEQQRLQIGRADTVQKRKKVALLEPEVARQLMLDLAAEGCRQRGITRVGARLDAVEVQALVDQLSDRLVALHGSFLQRLVPGFGKGDG